MGDVYRATDTRLHRAVAIKLVRAFDAADTISRKRFELEAQAASALNHPNICTVYDVGEAEGCPYLVMELLEGETLGAQLSRGSLQLSDVVDIGVQVADALDAAHAHHIVHRDIKPANIFVTTRRQVKVMDFGIATRLGHDAVATESATTVAAPTRLTDFGAQLGTVAYMSPEQARGEALDARTDLFSLGVVLYELTCGQRPFRGATDALVFDALLNRQPTPLRELRPDVPRELEALVSRLLERDRERRTPEPRRCCRSSGRSAKRFGATVGRRRRNAPDHARSRESQPQRRFWR
jgi:serine/threonine protein kinase